MHASIVRLSTTAGILLGLIGALGTPGANAEDYKTPPGGGSGSYAVTVPASAKFPGTDTTVKLTVPAVGPKLNPGKAYTKKAPTNDWWTPLVWVDPADLPAADPSAWRSGLTWKVFTDPLVIQPQKGGLRVSYNIPDTQRAASIGGVLTPGAGFMQEVVGDKDHGLPGISPFFNAFMDGDLLAGSDTAGYTEAAYSNVFVDDWSDWYVRFVMQAPTKSEEMTVTAGSGGPVVLIKLKTGKPRVTFPQWNVGKVVPLTGSFTDMNANTGTGSFGRAFAVINKVPTEKYASYIIYAVFAPTGKTWTITSAPANNTATCLDCAGGGYYAVAILPYAYPNGVYDEPDWQKVQQMLNHYLTYAFSEVTDTQVTPVYSHSEKGADVSVTYAYTTASVPNEGALSGTLRAVYPHQYVDQPDARVVSQSFQAITPTKLDNTWWWPTLKGPMLLAEGASFTNALEVPPVFPAVIASLPKADTDKMKIYLQQALDSQDPQFSRNGSYFGAQEMYRLAMLLPIADQLMDQKIDVSTIQQSLYTTVKTQMQDRLKAVTGASVFKNAAQHVLYYDSRWGTMIPIPEDGFAADSLLNDHHFHFGYFIKIATELARYEKEYVKDPVALAAGFANQYAPMIKLLIKDIANTSRTGSGADPDFPFLRAFSPYLGHSCANGNSRGDQGCQQESTSEAVQAWAACLLWAQLDFPHDPDNLELQKWAAYMLASEVSAARLYWFGFTSNSDLKPRLSFRQYRAENVNAHNPAPKPYRPGMVSQVNQNEMTFQTDFGNPPIFKYAIQWLPITGSSVYLGITPSDVNDNLAAYKADLTALGAGFTDAGWMDQVRMYQALSTNDTADARTLVTANAGGTTNPLDSWKMAWEDPAPSANTRILQYNSRANIFWWIKAHLQNGPPNVGIQASHASAAAYMTPITTGAIGRRAMYADAGANGSALVASDAGIRLADAEAPSGASGGVVTYVAYNPTDQTTTVTFSDGTQLSVPAFGGVTTTGGSSASADDSYNCAIATAAYGSPLHPYVRTLRAFRDSVLMRHATGRSFVAWYYRVSPPIAETIRNSTPLRLGARAVLIPLIAFAALSLSVGVAAALVIMLVAPCAASMMARQAYRLASRR
jgi:endoglucanase Acf2